MFQRTLATVRQVTAEEARAVRPLRIASRHRERGRDHRNARRRMAVDRPVERFLLLNGLDRDDRVKAGERYKIIVE